MPTLEQLVQQSVQGDKNALEEVIKAVQDMIYNLAIKVLWHPDDAKDVTQEILIKLISHLAKFEHRSSFKTWVYRLASNEILNYRKKHHQVSIDFDGFEAQLQQGFSDHISYTQNQGEQNLLIQEAKVGCSHAMLQCLDQESRLTYILGEILELNGQEAAVVLDIKPETYRKRLSRVRKTMKAFTQRNCGLVNSNNTCRCHKKVDHGIAVGNIQPQRLLFADSEEHMLIEHIEHIKSEVELLQSNPTYQTPEVLLREISQIIRQPEYPIQEFKI